MLRTETVTPETLELLKELMQDRLLTSFVLVGGTALALQIAHRRSIDIDLFRKEAFNETDKIFTSITLADQIDTAHRVKRVR